jgi:hypothetical protein
MMDKREWDAMSEREKNDLVWAAFPGIPPLEEEWVLSTDGGESCFISYDTEREAKRALLELEQSDIDKTDSRYGAQVFLWRHPRYFTTSRDALVWVEKEIERRGFTKAYSVLLLMGLRGEAYLLNAEGEKTKDVFEMEGLRKEVSLLDIRRADPDLCCYCALKAVANAH